LEVELEGKDPVELLRNKNIILDPGVFDICKKVGKKKQDPFLEVFEIFKLLSLF
jgi:hypothetical protein